MRNYCTPDIIKENSENFLIHRCKYILLSQVCCVWQVVKTPTIILITLYKYRKEIKLENGRKKRKWKAKTDKKQRIKNKGMESGRRGKREWRHICKRDYVYVWRALNKNPEDVNRYIAWKLLKFMRLVFVQRTVFKFVSLHDAHNLYAPIYQDQLSGQAQ
jgi:hypothetical protein